MNHVSHFLASPRLTDTEYHGKRGNGNGRLVSLGQLTEGTLVGWGCNTVPKEALASEFGSPKWIVMCLGCPLD